MSYTVTNDLVFTFETGQRKVERGAQLQENAPEEGQEVIPLNGISKYVKFVFKILYSM